MQNYTIYEIPVNVVISPGDMNPVNIFHYLCDMYKEFEKVPSILRVIMVKNSLLYPIGNDTVCYERISDIILS
jgi:hypothetical protein